MRWLGAGRSGTHVHLIPTPMGSCQRYYVQADNNDPNYVVGFLQRNATILRRKDETQDASSQIQDRVLYILHSHHDLENYLLERILRLLDTYLPYDKFDIVVITPNIMKVLLGRVDNGTSLLNPFFTRDSRSKGGASSYLSLPLALQSFLVTRVICWPTTMLCCDFGISSPTDGLKIDLGEPLGDQHCEPNGNGSARSADFVVVTRMDRTKSGLGGTWTVVPQVGLPLGIHGPTLKPS